MSDAVKAALEASSLALLNLRQGTTWERPEDGSLEWAVMKELLPTKETAVAVVAFLRALPVQQREPYTLASAGYLGIPTNWELASAVERAVQE